MPSRLEVEHLRFLCGTGVLSLSQFWKLSFLCRNFLVLRGDSRVQGLGGVVRACLASYREKAILRSFLSRCIDAGDSTPLKQLLAIQGVGGCCPGLLSRAISNKGASEECIAVLAKEAGEGGIFTFNPMWVSDLSATTLTTLLDTKVIDPNMWLHRREVVIRAVDPDFVPDGQMSGAIREKLGRGPPGVDCWRPLLSMLIDEKKYDCAEVLLDRGARVDVGEFGDDDSIALGLFADPEGRTPLHALVLALSQPDPEPPISNHEEGGGGEEVGNGDEPAGSGLSDTKAGMRLLERLSAAARQAGCLEWTARMVWDRDSEVPPDGHVEMSALALACACLKPQIVEILISAGAHVSGAHCAMLSFERHHPIRIAIEGLESKSRRELKVIRQEYDAYSLAIEGVLQKLEEGGARSESVGAYLLSSACRENKVRAMHVLIKRGVDVNGEKENSLEGRKFKTPLIECIQNHRWRFAKHLLKKGADPNRPSSKGGVSRRKGRGSHSFSVDMGGEVGGEGGGRTEGNEESEGVLPLQAALNQMEQAEDPISCWYLVGRLTFQFGARIDLLKGQFSIDAPPTSPRRAPPLSMILSIPRTHGPLLENILGSLPSRVLDSVPGPMQRFFGVSALAIALKMGYKKGVEALVAAGADVNKETAFPDMSNLRSISSSSGWPPSVLFVSPLAIAIWYKRWEEVQTLIDAGANLESARAAFSDEGKQEIFPPKQLQALAEELAQQHPFSICRMLLPESKKDKKWFSR
uniref:Uncharacterized protein n=1 Tax=Chromera velia CCMP2878 TaxID=1169474 RepID=A0A0G4I394_9ALVE|eukprot:Cvel_10586.t1-p1 / transcript=Cvel_10586.t1 / gene=Cvel_10586 / organism=Chromera_velia_CCMP2878 / gene_product=hypothetical protein / transcript_product=hypothetical protein / location=Cvel_scaffold642:28584-32868(+) / protein_length=750 / sequence_SO=supercontig / SO=protein_coding / is_pseudo=false